MLTSFQPRSLLVIALGSALVSGISTSALADSSGPTWYGRANVSFDHFNNQGAALIPQAKAKASLNQWQLNSNASRLGIKGALDLDQPSLPVDQVVYQAEYEINVDDGNTGADSFNQRNIFVGLSGGFGLVTAGKFDTPLKTAEGKIDQFNDLAGDFDALIGGQNRLANIVQYTSPNVANFVFNAAIIPAEGTDANKDGINDGSAASTISSSVIFDNQTFYGALAYDKDQAARRSLDSITRADIIRAVATVKQGDLEAGVLLQNAQDSAPNSKKEDSSYLLSAAWNFDRTKIKAQYGSSKGKVSDEKGTLLDLGVDYKLAKKTIAYAYWSSLDLDKANLTDKTVGIGVSHSF